MSLSRYRPVNEKTFHCDRYCGKCCRSVIVLPTKEDIVRILHLGYAKSEFLAREEIGPHQGEYRLLRKENGDCVFLEKDKEGKYSCKIHTVKPDICKKYPFTGVKMDDCRDLSWNVKFTT